MAQLVEDRASNAPACGSRAIFLASLGCDLREVLTRLADILAGAGGLGRIAAALHGVTGAGGLILASSAWLALIRLRMEVTADSTSASELPGVVILVRRASIAALLASSCVPR